MRIHYYDFPKKYSLLYPYIYEISKDMQRNRYDSTPPCLTYDYYCYLRMLLDIDCDSFAYIDNLALNTTQDKLLEIENHLVSFYNGKKKKVERVRKKVINRFSYLDLEN